jgi:hypothetical protein
MARKWERMIDKNKKKMNEIRSKQGKALISDTDPVDRFVGRSWLLPLFLIGFSFLFMIAFGGIYRDGMYWFTVLSYLLLGLIIYFLRRPYLNLGKNEISSRRFSGQKFIKASDVQQIYVSPGFISIQFKGRKARWVFSRLFHRFDTDAMAVKLKEFAQLHSIPLKEE